MVYQSVSVCAEKEGKISQKSAVFLHTKMQFQKIDQHFPTVHLIASVLGHNLWPSEQNNWGRTAIAINSLWLTQEHRAVYSRRGESLTVLALSSDSNKLPLISPIEQCRVFKERWKPHCVGTEQRVLAHNTSDKMEQTTVKAKTSGELIS